MKGIYLITNNLNGKQYVGLSNNINRRFSEHKSRKCKTAISKAFRKYNVENFTFEILEIVDDIKKLPEREIFWIDKLKPKYNMTAGGLGNSGREVKSETIELLKLAGKLQWSRKTDEEKNKIINNNLKGPTKGRKLSLETKLKLRNINLGKKQSLETIEKRASKIKISQIGNKNGNKSVICYKENSEIKIYESIVAAAAELKIHPSNITKVLKGKQKTAAGFFWKYYTGV